MSIKPIQFPDTILINARAGVRDRIKKIVFTKNYTMSTWVRDLIDKALEKEERILEKQNDLKDNS